MKVLIIGVTGMIGSHIARVSKERGYTVYGIARSSAASRMSVLDTPDIIRCDILDYENLLEIFKKVKPDIVFHMAAQAFNGISWQTEELTHKTNYFGTLNVLRCVKQIVPKAKVMLAGSSTVYGMFDPKECPLVEERSLHPITPYGVSKLATEALGYQYAENYSIKVYLPRLFIHVGTGHPPATAIQNFAKQLALIKKGKMEPTLTVGNLETARDFIDVRDGVNAMFLILDKGNSGEPINICTSSSHKISDILNTLIAISGLEIKIKRDKGLLRVSDEQLLVGDNTKIKKLGWKQKYTIEQTLTDVYNDWLERIDRQV